MSQTQKTVFLVDDDENLIFELKLQAAIERLLH